MPTIDPCENCKEYKNDEKVCEQQDSTIDDGLPCSNYVEKDTVELEPQEDKIDIPDLPRGEIRGWLTFFLALGVGVGSILSFFLGIKDFSMEDFVSPWFGGLTNMLGYVFAFFSIVLFPVLAAYVIYSFYTYKPNAVFLGKMYLIVIFLSNVLVLFGGEEDSVGSYRLLKALFWSVIWFVYLCVSKQVNELFPKRNRKIYKRDKYLIATIIAIPLIYFASILGDVFMASYQAQQSRIESTLKSGELSDGRVAFILPTEFLAEKQINDDGETYFTMSLDNGGSATVYSGYADEDIPDDFSECMNNWRDQEMDDFDFVVISQNSEIVNGNIIQVKSLQYHADPILEWTFSLIYNTDKKICCLISYYHIEDGETPNYFDEIASSVRFK